MTGRSRRARRRALAALAIAAAGVAPATARAQRLPPATTGGLAPLSPDADTVPVRRGDEATVRTPVLGDGRPLRATVWWVRGDSLGLRVPPYAETYALAAADVRALTVRRRYPGYGWRAWKAAGVGALLGGAAGFLFGEAVRCKPASYVPPGTVDLSCDTGTNDFRPGLTVLGGAVGSGLGALVWSLVEPRRWVPARLRRGGA